MDQLNRYQTLVKELLRCQAEQMERSPSEIETELSFDDVHRNYLLLSIGWTKQGRTLTPTIYIRLHDGKIYVENDWTKAGIVDQLHAQGVPPEDIVLAFHPPEMRQHTKFAGA